MSQSFSKRRSQLLKSIAEADARIAGNEAQRQELLSKLTPDDERLSEQQRKLRKKAKRLGELLEEDRVLAAQLRNELKALDEKIASLERDRRAALEWLNRLSSPEQLLAELRIDPAAAAPGETRSGPRQKIAKKILEFRDQQPGRVLKDIDHLLSVKGVDEALIGDLVFTGAAVIQATLGTVGVLLPVRLETRFYPPSPPAGWRLRVRVVPDEASLDRHSPLASDLELDSVEEMWQTVDGDLTDSDPVKDKSKASVWSGFVSRHGGARAAWLARRFQPFWDGAKFVIGRPAERLTEPDFGRVIGFPRTIELWMGRGGKKPDRIATMPVLTAQLSLDFPEGLEADQRWWSSWAEAVRVGLGIEVDLGPQTPNDIDVLYAVGLGDDSPETVFAAHRDAGVMALLEPGVATNSVDGDPAADLGADAETWRRVVIAAANPGPPTSTADIRKLGSALTGLENALMPMPGMESSFGTLAQAMMMTLCPLFWVQTLHLIWNLGPEGKDASTAKALEVARWVTQNVCPLGPLRSIRIADQPYGILPVTSLDDWPSTAGSPLVEESIKQHLIEFRDAWERAASATGTIHNADTEKLLMLLGRGPISSSYSYRLFFSLEMLYTTLWTEADGTEPGTLENWWNETAANAIASQLPGYVNILFRPNRRYATFGSPQDLKVPLVLPDGLAGKDLSTIVKGITASPFSNTTHKSLLLTLIRLAVIISQAESAGLGKGAGTIELLDPLKLEDVRRLERTSRLETAARRYNESKPGTLVNEVRAAANHVAAFPAPDIERTMLATLDTFSHRVDPWITAFAWRRLSSYNSSTHRWKLGIYGWVDSPRPRQPGDPSGEFFLAPSEAQAMAAVVLRDKAINDPQPGRWDMRIESNTIRLAKTLAEQVKGGLQPAEAFGLEVERIAAERTVVDELRKQFPIREEHDGRRICHGLAVLSALFDGSFVSPSQQAALDQLSAATSELRVLRSAVDAYGDLLMTDAVYWAINERGERAGATMDAAAGMTRPPDFEPIDSPSDCRSISTSVLIALSDPPTSPDDPRKKSPGFVADPAVAQFIEDVLGTADGKSWRWTRKLESGTDVVQLSEIGFLPVDAAILPAESLLSLLNRAKGHEGVVDAELSIGSLAHSYAVQLLTMLGARPAVPADLADSEAPEKTDGPTDTETLDGVKADLSSRLFELRRAADDLAARLRHGSATEQEGRTLLSEAARWGICPVSSPGEAVAETLLKAASALNARLEATRVSDPEMTPEGIASAISRLASPDGVMPVFSRLSLNSVSTSFSPDSQLDASWLTVASAVRPALARLEAFQFDGLIRTSSADDTIKTARWTPLVAITNHPGDPWRTGAKPLPDDDFIPPTKLVCIYGTNVSLKRPRKDRLAMGLLDAWTEFAPRKETQIAVAFRFDAPKARAPQAILLAVPPDESQSITTEVLINILGETRQLARARMASPDEQEAFAAGLPVAMLPLYEDIPTHL